jgi:hypothetical protein
MSKSAVFAISSALGLAVAAGCSSSSSSGSPASGLPDSGPSTGNDSGSSLVSDAGEDTSPEEDASPDSAPGAADSGADAADAGGDAMATLNAGLVAYYPFDGDTRDHSGNGNDCTVVGTGATLTTDRHGNTNAAYQLENNTYMDCGSGSSLDIMGDLTLSAWVNPDAVSLTGINRIVVGTASYLMGINDQNLAAAGQCDLTQGPFFALKGQSATPFLCSPTKISAASTWHQIVGVYVANSAVTLYLDGSLVASIAQGVPSSVYANSEHLQIGPNVGANYAAYFAGSLDEVRVYGRALSSAEIAALP